MKLFKFLSVFSAGALALLMTTSCENKEVEFPDFEYTTVYFPYQFPVRTIVLGEDIFDNTLDNEHKLKIYATMGGVYENNKNIEIDIAVDDALTSNLFFEDESAVQPMPADYYSLAEQTISLSGELQGGVDVQLSDAFFADENAISNTYVIPLRMTGVSNADSILDGTPLVDNPVRTNVADWEVQPKDFVLYAVRFINPWHANYLRRGEDIITENGETTTIVRHEEYVEDDEVVSLHTSSLNSVIFPVQTTVMQGEEQVTLTCELVLTFDENNECSIVSGTEGYTASGSGQFVKDGDKNSWGDEDRNALYLDYEVDFGTKQYQTKDTLVVRDRGVKIETFNPTYTE
ncbi:DUF5627 domain-containing protein [Marinilabilia salmonicolor]|uniref:DUF5627 domain-containing protein n=1 Tax=Marinilabilia salmonicolor TaxID=989 RepID=UPI000D0812D9|nr:DUF5627 domain-containing protein [Marinilabilia salmonicolor]